MTHRNNGVLALACRLGRHECTKVLIKHGAGVKFRKNKKI